MLQLLGKVVLKKVDTSNAVSSVAETTASEPEPSPVIEQPAPKLEKEIPISGESALELEIPAIDVVKKPQEREKKRDKEAKQKKEEHKSDRSQTESPKHKKPPVPPVQEKEPEPEVQRIID